MRFVTFRTNTGAVEPGLVLQDGRIASLAAAGFRDLIAVIAGGDAARQTIEKVAADARWPAVYESGSVRLMAPIPRPPKVICVGLNYRDHAAESNMKIPDVPTIFCKFPTAVIGPGDPIILPKKSTKPDYEAEFAFVIGKGGRYISRDRWREHVFGYMNLNDVSARDYQMATTQWLMGKTFDTFCPTGPWLVSADEIPDPHQLDVKLILNGEVMQHSNTRELIFRIPVLIEHLSEVFTLEPGDIVSTGTPAGVGMARKPPRFLQAGDEVVVSVQGLGDLQNPVMAER
jgi:2-keto-4-pentenoate hydratase/2-oxohepta-3-ene-1,7-dioic acid hydratase in catechol pathway